MGVVVESGLDPLPWTLFPYWGKDSTMAKSRLPYPPEFRQRIIELVRIGKVEGMKRRAKDHPGPPPPLSLAELATLYRRCNETRFGGRLPTARVDWQEPGGGRVASTHPMSALGPSIWISPMWSIGRSKAWIRQVLLHEMCHIEVGTGADGERPTEDLEHGPRWCAAMLRLGEQGERWVHADLRKMEESEAERIALVEPMLRAMDKLDPSLTLDEVCKLLLRRFGRWRSRMFGYSARDLILSDIRIVQYWSELRRQDEASRHGECG